MDHNGFARSPLDQTRMQRHTQRVSGDDTGAVHAIHNKFRGVFTLKFQNRARRLRLLSSLPRQSRDDGSTRLNQAPTTAPLRSLLAALTLTSPRMRSAVKAQRNADGEHLCPSPPRGKSTESTPAAVGCSHRPESQGHHRSPAEGSSPMRSSPAVTIGNREGIPEGHSHAHRSGWLAGWLAGSGLRGMPGNGGEGDVTTIG